MKLLGVKWLLLSNAAGGINKSYHKSDLMLLDDHINLLPGNPLTGANIDEMGPRFPDMSCPYSPDINALLETAARKLDITLDLVRRMYGDEVYGATFSLLTTSEGKKMGKSQSGAIWLDPNKTPPYDFFQYWRNVEDADVMRCLKMLTFLPVEQIDEEFGKLEGDPGLSR